MTLYFPEGRQYFERERANEEKIGQIFLIQKSLGNSSDHLPILHALKIRYFLYGNT